MLNLQSYDIQAQCCNYIQHRKKVASNTGQLCINGIVERDTKDLSVGRSLVVIRQYSTPLNMSLGLYINLNNYTILNHISKGKPGR